MKQHEIEAIKKLDLSGNYGTIQSILMNPKLGELHFTQVLYELIIKIKGERDGYEIYIKKLENILKENNLYTSENILGE